MIGIVFQSLEPECGPVGRGGLLIIVAGGLIYTMFEIPVGFVRDWLPILLSPETWAILADPQAYDYHPSLPAFLVFQLAVSALVGFSAFVGLILFAQRSEHFPKYMITYYLGSFALLLAVLIIEVEMWANDPTGHHVTAGEAGRAFLWAMAAVPYFARSRRVKNTFLKPTVPAATPSA